MSNFFSLSKITPPYCTVYTLPRQQQQSQMHNCWCKMTVMPVQKVGRGGGAGPDLNYRPLCHVYTISSFTQALQVSLLLHSYKKMYNFPLKKSACWVDSCLINNFSRQFYAFGFLYLYGKTVLFTVLYTVIPRIYLML